MNDLSIGFSSNISELSDLVNQLELKIKEIETLLKKIEKFEIVISFEKPS